MAKTTAPVLSFGASGSLAKTIVYSKWKGRDYARRHVIPANPQSVAQTLTRDVFRSAGEIWKLAGPLLIAPWDRFAQGQVLTGRNAFTSSFVKVLRSQPDLTTMVFSPGAKGGLAPTSVIVTPSANTLTCDITPPTPPTGWTLDSCEACAILDAAPSTMTVFTTVEGSDNSTPYSVALAGLTSSVLYIVGAWTTWSKPDGSKAYGPSILSSGTPS